MNSQERHQLQQNELRRVGHQMGDMLKSSWFDKHGNQVLMGISIAALALAAWIYWSRSRAATESFAWIAYSEAQQTAASLKSIGSKESDYGATAMAPWALLRSVELRLSAAVSESFTNREKSKEELKVARDTLDDLMSRSLTPDVRERAMFVQARYLEIEGDVDGALKAYEAFKTDYPDSVLTFEADRRISALERPEAKEFYAWFGKQKPVPPAPAGPKDKAAGTGDDSGDKSELPTLDQPEKTVPEEKSAPKKLEAPKPDAGKAEPSKTEGPKLSAPKADAPTEKPEPAKPEPAKPEAEKKPEPEKKAEPEKKPEAPADKPAGDKPADKPAEQPK